MDLIATLTVAESFHHLTQIAAEVIGNFDPPVRGFD
jgi:hypothetical protein